MNQAALRGTGTPLHSYIRTIRFHPHFFLFWSCQPRDVRSSLCLLCPACLLSYFPSDLKLYHLRLPPCLSLRDRLRFLEQLSPTPLQPSCLPVPPLGQPSIPTCSQVRLLHLRGCHALLWLPRASAVWQEGLLTTPRVYFMFTRHTLSRFLGPTLNFASLFGIFFFEPDVSG